MTAPITGRPARAGFALLLALVWMCFTASAGAQSPATAAVRGRVTDPSGALIAGATITIASPTTGVTRTTRSGSDGAYTIADVPLTGAYTLTVTRDGFATQQKGPFTLAGSQTANFDVTLAPAGVSEEIRVSGTFDGVRADAPQLGTRFDTQKIRETPLLGNKLTTVPLLNSAVRSGAGHRRSLPERDPLRHRRRRPSPDHVHDRRQLQRRLLGPADDLRPAFRWPRSRR